MSEYYFPTDTSVEIEEFVRWANIWGVRMSLKTALLYVEKTQVPTDTIVTVVE